ncbi:MAG: hypothetical protein EOP49_41800 [Sphingobacteriales bacterium]|nr:MAG: hypothetical protein EOP49_41800 [Sphingobacteriales bacterium]
MIDFLAASPSSVIALIDLGFLDNHNFNTLGTVAVFVIQALYAMKQDWLEVVAASGSFPENLNGMTPGSIYRLERLEWHIRQVIITTEGLEQVRYGDYGTKNPAYSEANFQGTSSIKYTIEFHYLIYRGELPQNHPRGAAQYIDHAVRLTGSADYMGAAFSWGDQRIHEIAASGTKTGNATTWVEISQNHHVTLIHSLL